MIAFPAGARVWLAGGATDMRRGSEEDQRAFQWKDRPRNGLTFQVQEGLGRDPHAGELFVFRRRRGHMVKILWNDGVGLSLYAKRLDHGRFIWPTPMDGAVEISAAQMGTAVQKSATVAAGCDSLTKTGRYTSAVVIAARPVLAQDRGNISLPRWPQSADKQFTNSRHSRTRSHRALRFANPRF